MRIKINDNVIMPEACKFVPLTSIVPETWRGWFYVAISENAPFSWGDSIKPLIDPKRFAEYVADVVIGYQEEKWRYL